MIFIKIEVEENEGYNSLIITPRDDDDVTHRQMELIYHAVMSQQPKKGGMIMGAGIMKIDVKKEDLVEEFNVVVNNK